MLRPTQKHTHVTVRGVAQEIAAAAYEQFAKDNAFRKLAPSQKAFVARCWGRFIPDARRSLAALLARPDYPEAMKRQIHDALLSDAAVRGFAIDEPT
jgi:hypothetical protein